MRGNQGSKPAVSLTSKSAEDSEICTTRTRVSPRLLGQEAQDSLDLRRVHIEACFGPDEIVGAGDLLIGRPLSLEALLDLFGRPAAGPEALLLGGGGTGDTDGRIQLSFGLSLEQERNHDYGKQTTLCPPSLHLGAPKHPDTGMKDFFEPLAGSDVGEDTAGQLIAAQSAIRPGDLGAEGGQNLRQGRLAGLNDLSRQIVGIHYWHPARAKEPGRGGLAHANATG
jgi:hypothetical protein